MSFVLKNIWLVLAALVSGAILVWPFIARRLSGVPEVGAQQAVQLLNRRDAIMVDVREPGEFGSGHAPNAKNIPAGQLDKRIGELEKFRNRPVVVVCQTGARAHAVTAQLRKAGFGEVVVLAGGIGAWQQANMPVEK
ncbi:MAG TPA: rhodanese-like domain-containing protein [Burkholderiales bacterium]|nr:rhodanese-like domain-containing protein [Burkholderiales bacterium]